LHHYAVDDAISAPAAFATSQPINDGSPHVLMWVQTAANQRRAYCDGVQIASNTATLGTHAASRLLLGAARLGGTTVSNPFTGSIAAAAIGAGSIPDPAALSADWLSGTFAAAGGNADGQPPAPFGFRHLGLF
jgi:hypothetical protein